MDAVMFRRWIEENEIFKRSIEKFWTHFREELCEDWAKELMLDCPLKEQYIDVRLHEISMKIREVSNSLDTQTCDHVEVRLNVFFKEGYAAHFNVHFDLMGKWLSFECGLNMIFNDMKYYMNALEDIKNQLKTEVAIVKYDINERAILVDIIDEKLEGIKASFA